ncbi:MAG: GTPase Era, partial [Candidatus Nephrothrix sp. EaCA]
MENTHKAGFVSIIGKPNAGKSTLMNKLLGEPLSIITPKAQTTRRRIMGMLNGEDFQIVYSDTPGLLHPNYELHQAMMNCVKVSLEDADLVLLVVDVFETCDELLKEA